MDLEKPKLLRTYTIICPNDEYNILNGKCPNYALNCGIQRNLDYWVEGHDFISGKYNLSKDYKTGVTLDEYERIRDEKIKYDHYISQETKNYFKKKREKLKKDMKNYLSSHIYNENTYTLFTTQLE
jgi:hypothetical protein